MGSDAETRGSGPTHSNKRRRSRSHSRSRSPSRRRPRQDENDELPQPYNARSLQPAKRRALSPSDHSRRQKRPSRRAQISGPEREAIRQRQLQRERDAAAAEAARAERDRHRGPGGAVNDVVKDHYNNVPERGRDWRKTDSRIRGLRSFNNWVKSCIIQRFSPDDDVAPGQPGGKKLLVLDVGCGKGGDLQKWQQAPQGVELYVGLDPADVSIDQAKERYRQMASRGGGGRGGHRGGRPPPRLFDARFLVQDCFGESIEEVDIVRQVGFDPSPMNKRGFDVVSMMFCMHYAFESEEKARMMLRNIAGALTKGGRLVGCIPNSDVLSERVRRFNAQKRDAAASGGKKKGGVPDAETSGGKDGGGEAVEDGEAKVDGGEEVDGEAKEDGSEAKEEGEASDGEVEEGEAESHAEWGNSIYRVRFPGPTPDDGVFRPAFGWKYSYFLDEAVEEVPEYVVPWEAFRALAEDYNLELQYHKTFADVWEAEKDDADLGPLSERMGVRGRGRGELLVSPEEMEAAGFYVAFCFYKV